MIYLGDFAVGETIYFPFDTYGGSGESITMTGLATSDIEIYKNGSTTQRASDNGYALLDTDGIDFDGVTGLHGFSIDLSDNSDAGFYAAGSVYWVNVNAITVNSQTVRFTFYFTIGKLLRPATAGRTLEVDASGIADADVRQWLGTACATPTVAGVPKTEPSPPSYTTAASSTAGVTITGTGERYSADKIEATGTSGPGIRLTSGSSAIKANLIRSGSYDAIIVGEGTHSIEAVTILASENLVAIEGAGTVSVKCQLAVTTGGAFFAEGGTGKAIIDCDTIICADFSESSEDGEYVVTARRIVGPATAVIAGSTYRIIGARMTGNWTVVNGTLELIGCTVLGNLTQSSTGVVRLSHDTVVLGTESGTITRFTARATDASGAALATATSVAALPTLDGADAIETGLTLRGALRLICAALAGKLSGANTNTETFRNVGDTKDRITATVDAAGNRTAITTDTT